MTSETTIRDLLDQYEGILLDAYGVLVDGRGALPAAVPLFRELERRGKQFTIVTNDASRSSATYVRRFAGYGIAIAAERFVTSGSLLPAYFKRLSAPRTLVLGTDDSVDFVRAGGGVPVPVEPGAEIDAVAICDDSGTPFLDGIEIALSAIVRAVDAGRRPTLVVPNPDLVYPKGEGELGFTAGAMALLIEAALARRFPEQRLTFDRLGKPEPHLFIEAARRIGVQPSRLVMIGDQLETDVAGAQAAGIDTALLAGVSRHDTRSAVTPTYVLGTIQP